MMRFKLFVFIVGFLLFLQFANAQKEHNNWYFGGNAAITFNTIPPVALPNTPTPMLALAGCASISDSAGNLLFYTNGGAIFDASHSGMLNGNLLGNVYTAQSTIIVPHPTNLDLYYVFSKDYYSFPLTYGVYYSIVDMTLNGGLGAVTSNNVQIHPTEVSGHMTAIRHSNGLSFWVIIHDINSNNFSAYEVTATGVNPTPVVSSIGSIFASPLNQVGCMKGSPDGKLLATASLGTPGIVELYDFDNSTGVLSNTRLLDNIDSYGVEFSPNSELLYVSESTGLVQFNLNAGSLAAIKSSKTVVGPGGLYSLQLAPDNKLYIAVNQSYSLSRINLPNVLGTSCGYQPQAVILDTLTSISFRGLPNYIGRVQFPFLAVEEPNCFGDTTYFTFNDSSVIDSVLWNFGDPASGAMNQSKLFEPYHIFSDTGTFIISAVTDFTPLYSATPVHTTLYDTVRILSLPNVDLGPDTNICPGDTIFYNLVEPNTHYRWQNNSTVPYQYVMSPGTYWVKATDKNQCTYSDTVEVGHIPPLNIPYDFQDTSLCTGDFFRLEANYPDVDYTWQDSSSNDFFDISQPGKYWVKWENACESVSDTLNVVYLDAINLDLGNDTIFCFGQEFLLHAGVHPEASYNWQDGSSDSVYTAVEAGIYWVKVENKCETVTDSITLSHLFPPYVYLGEDSTLCHHNTLLLDAKNVGSSYLWQDGSTGRYMWVDMEGVYWVDVTNTCATDNDSILSLFTYPPLVNLGADTLICENEVLILDAFNKASTYLWQDGSTASQFQLSNEGYYYVEVKNVCGTANDEINVREKDCSCPVFVPNAFTPGNDDINEEFRIYGPCEMKEFELTIFNRWGEEIYRSNNPEEGWNGTFAGRSSPTGAYAWKLKYRTSNRQSKEQVSSGIVNLLR